MAYSGAMYPLIETIRATIFNYKRTVSNVELENLALIAVDQSRSNYLDCLTLANAEFSNRGK